MEIRISLGGSALFDVGEIMLLGLRGKGKLTTMCQDNEIYQDQLNNDDKGLTKEQKKEIDRVKEIIKKVEGKDTLSQL